MLLPSLMCLLLLLFGRLAGAQLLNHPPHFVPGSGDMSRFSLSEHTPVGSPVYQLKGIDPEGGRLKYSISGPVFSVDRETGVVRLRQELDRETQDTVEVIISITDEGIYGTEPNTVSQRREIPVRDYNDNQPTFYGRPYTASVSESLPVGSELTVEPAIIVVDRDDGLNAEVQIKCVQENDICDIFEVRAVKLSDGNFTARVALKQPLDFESRPSYIMTISASDGAIENRLTSFATISINVIDVQDQAPVFTNAPYSATVAENTPAGVSILTVKAIDGDVGIPREIFLSLEDEPFGHFELVPFGDAKEGTAILQTTSEPLDRENPDILQNGGVYVFSIRATELIDGAIPAEHSVTRVTIVVTDVDDHRPEFSASHFNISIAENLANGMPLPGLSIFVDDRDMGENSRYQLKLQDVSKAAGVFAVSPTEAQGRTPVVVKVLNASQLDYDNPAQRTFEFDLVATTHGVEQAKARVEVHLLDANDNAPVFRQQTYRFTAPENLTIDSLVGIVNASDADSAEFGHVQYVLKGFGADNFYINPETGGIYLLRALDYEKQSTYSLTVVAVDGGGRESNANLYVDVLDVNDNHPRFESTEYSRTIREGASIFEPQFFVRAHDADGPSQGNGRVKYAIVSENSIAGNVFRIEPETGEITLQKAARSMDTERGEYELVVSATDFGIPPLTNTTRVLIRVGISGNQRPIFKGHFQNVENLPVIGPPSYRVSIPENAAPGYNVTTVSAHDPDGLDSLLRYRIVGANDNFQINEFSGLITVSPQARIDRDLNMNSFEIIVNAVDSGTPIPETATTTVYVNVKDINDEKPKFEQNSYAAYVSERTVVGESVLRVKAIDKDLNSRLEYSLQGPVQATTKAGVSIANRSNYPVQEAFRVDKESGEIFVNSSLRHDVAAIIIFTVAVRDLNAEVDPEKQVDTTEVTVYVQSFKDKDPVFKNPGWSSSRPVVNIKIKEEMPIDSALFILQAEDPVTEQPITSFELVTPKELEYFHISERTGEVILKKRLDYEELAGSGSAEFELQVRANSADRQRSTISRVNITVENVNDNSPTFDQSSYQATIIENKGYPEPVLQVKAQDKDAALNARDERLGYHKIIYSLQGEYAMLFEINNLTGQIIVARNQTIDRERTPSIRLQVKAEDSPGKPTDAKQSVAELLIDVLDVNDNAPEFTKKAYSTVIPENALKMESVLQLEATDADEGPGGEVRYELVNEGDANGLFSINAQSGLLTTRRNLTGKGRAEAYVLIVRAQDNGNQVPKQSSLSTDAEVRIFIGDVSANDGVPYFVAPRVGQMANVTENAAVGAPVFQVIARDPDDDSTPSGTITYRILPDTPDAESFAIDTHTGLITTRQELDREEKSMYKVLLEVSDNGQPKQSVTRILKIEVLDMDDHVPRFAREIDAGPIPMAVREEQPAGTIVGNFSAIDEDIGENAAIDYAIIEGNNEQLFTIERNNNSLAILKTSQPIDREQVESFTLTIKCLKLGEPAYKYIGDVYDRQDPSHLRITVKILDIDDNLPKFENPDSTVGIRINVPIDTVITTLRATDADAEAAPIALSIKNVTFVPQFYKRSRQLATGNLQTLFTLNNRTGELRTGGSFADYVDGYFQMRVCANNSAKAKRQTYSNIKVFVIRDKSLLKFVFARPPNEIQHNIRPFQEQLQKKLKPLGLELHVLDTQVFTRADMSLDFTATSSCFQMFRNGAALSLSEMQKLMNSKELRHELIDIYAAYGVSDLESCSVRRTHTAALFGNLLMSAGAWLVILAALIGIAALVSLCTACCLRKKFKRYSKRSLQASLRTPTEHTPTSYSYSMPAVLYSEPIYGPL
ncbi:cadherin-23 [Drosophila hydei]|uniref:Cadherin-23 n=1 Tax=Drosophila hydei TaxID=7224 RepID=A0A6J2SZA7_DROHY|nr:cadherin-23 [Drosophila hydei]XP_030081478.1 cadherin-23 [Drosophila hydei]XP_030081479.1 cadherin-23 [Drosophila hydei]XP_030081480.1 cadherin-23 [Drosophila hydei]